MTDDLQPLRIALGGDGSVSGLLQGASGAQACLVLAHGAGAGMTHAFMASLAGELARHRIATLRYQFPYMEKGSKRPDTPTVAHAAVRAAVAEAARRLPQRPLFAGGKSFGARMTSQAQAKQPLEGVRGLVFVGFPLHPAKQPSVERAKHLADVKIPMLFLQGTRDALAEWPLVEQTVRGLGSLATLERIEDADHSFHVRASSGTTDAEVVRRLAGAAAQWIVYTTGAAGSGDEDGAAR